MKSLAKSMGSRIRCAIYTRKSSEEGLDQSFNSLHAQREACEAFIQSQRHEGWVLSSAHYDDGGFSGGNMERPALSQLINQIKQGLINIIVVYKVDRLSRSLADFVRLVDLFDRYKVSFVSVTQQFNTATSMGRLTLNVLLSFAQFEREVTGERIRDKIAASKKKGMWMGGVPPLGYDVKDKTLVINDEEACTVRHICTRYLDLGSVRTLKLELDRQSIVSKVREKDGKVRGGVPLSRGALYCLLRNPLYIGKVAHNGQCHEGQHKAILDRDLWDRVQNQLAHNKHKNELKTTAKDPSLLTGRLFDDKNHPMSPTHTRKKNRRYRYYVSQALLLYRELEAGSVSRIPAQTVEDRVVGHIKKTLRNSHKLLSLLSPLQLPAQAQKGLIARAKDLADDWETMSLGDQIDLIKRFIRHVIVSQKELRISISTTHVAAELLDAISLTVDLNGKQLLLGDYEVVLPVHLKRCGIETRLIVPNDDEPDTQAHPNTVQAIQQALAKALNWNQALLDGSAQSMTELAKQNSVTQRYVAHLIKLAFLAPDIVKAIVRGDIPRDLSLDKLKAGFPLDWDEQRSVLGFSQ